MLAEYLYYVIAGGDFNQIFSSAKEKNPFTVKDGMWAPGVIDTSDFGEEWQFEMDTSVPSCRSLDRPYEDGENSDFQFYIIDGFIVSPNVQVDTLETIDRNFISSDHNPVYMRVTLLP